MNNKNTLKPSPYPTNIVEKVIKKCINSCATGYRNYANNITRKEISKLFLFLFKPVVVIM